MTTPSATERRREGQARRARRRSAPPDTGTLRARRAIPYVELASAEAIERIEAQTDRLLERIGVEYRDDIRALGIWREAGAEVDGVRVRMDARAVRELCRTAPSEFVQHARNPARSVRIGGPNAVFAPVYGPPFVRCLDEGMGNVNVNSPLVFDRVASEAIRAYCGANQGIVIVPFVLGGAMGPVTTVAAVAQALAEAMSGVAFAQLVRPGAPVVLGNFLSSMSLRSGAPTFGMPEAALSNYLVGQLARRLQLPFRSGGSLTASKLCDAQAAYESAYFDAALVDFVARRRAAFPDAWH